MIMFNHRYIEHKEIYNGDQFLFKFKNGYGASVVRFTNNSNGVFRGFLNGGEYWLTWGRRGTLGISSS